jgi:hypothetical protein
MDRPDLDARPKRSPAATRVCVEPSEWTETTPLEGRLVMRLEAIALPAMGRDDSIKRRRSSLEKAIDAQQDARREKPVTRAASLFEIDQFTRTITAPVMTATIRPITMKTPHKEGSS